MRNSSSKSHPFTERLLHWKIFSLGGFLCKTWNYWSKGNTNYSFIIAQKETTLLYILLIKARKKFRFHWLTSYMNMLVYPSELHIHILMFLANQFFLPLPGLPSNVNGKCASQNTKSSIHFPQFCISFYLAEESRGTSRVGWVWDDKEIPLSW